MGSSVPFIKFSVPSALKNWPNAYKIGLLLIHLLFMERKPFDIMKLRRILPAVSALFVLAFFCLGFDGRLETTYYTVQSERLPASFDGFRIVLLTDFHLKEFGRNEEPLIQAVRDCEPDLIALCGDIIDDDHDSIQPLDDLLKGIAPLAPVFFVSGNHEFEASGKPIPKYQEMKALFSRYGVTDLDDDSTLLSRGNDSIRLSGRKWRSRQVTDGLKQADPEYFNILLFHGGNSFDKLSPYGYDLILSGHTHGGVVRLPFLGGVFSNTGTLFPKYDAGLFQENGSTMVLSRGLGDARLPRFYNRPETVCVTLKR